MPFHTPAMFLPPDVSPTLLLKGVDPVLINLTSFQNVLPSPVSSLLAKYSALSVSWIFSTLLCAYLNLALLSFILSYTGPWCGLPWNFHSWKAILDSSYDSVRNSVHPGTAVKFAQFFLMDYQVIWCPKGLNDTIMQLLSVILYIMGNNAQLYRYDMKNNITCDLCGQGELNYRHLFIECNKVNKFFIDVKQWIAKKLIST